MVEIAIDATHPPYNQTRLTMALATDHMFADGVVFRRFDPG